MANRKKTYMLLVIITIAVAVSFYRFFPLKSSKAENWERIVLLSHKDTPCADGAHMILPADLNGDGQVELVGTAYRADAAIIFNYDSTKGDRTIAKAWNWQVLFCPLRDSLDPDYAHSNKFAMFLDMGDINRDGYIDIMIPLHTGSPDVVWLENPGGEAALDKNKWIKHSLFNWNSSKDEPDCFSYEARLVDADGNGSLDVVVTTKEGGDIYLVRNPINDKDGKDAVRKTWTIQTFLHHNKECDWKSADSSDWTYSAAIGQINGNGPKEIIGGIRGRGIYYWTYTGNGKSDWSEDQWKEYPISEVRNGGIDGYFMDAFDIEGDGGDDIVTESKNPKRGDIAILRNPATGNSTNWNYIIIDNIGRDGRQFSVGDINLDGHNDIAMASSTQNLIVWYENKGSTWYNGWKRHLIDNDITYTSWSHFVELVDIDYDGSLDVLYATPSSFVDTKGYFNIYFNRINPAK
jgi:hypothetical protein